MNVEWNYAVIIIQLKKHLFECLINGFANLQKNNPIIQRKNYKLFKSNRHSIE